MEEPVNRFEGLANPDLSGAGEGHVLTDSLSLGGADRPETSRLSVKPSDCSRWAAG